MKTMKTKVQLSALMFVAFGSSTVMADAHAEKKKAPDTKAPDAKKAPEPKKEAPKAMEMPKPAPEIEAMAKGMIGTWNCTGKSMTDPAKPTETADFKAKMTSKIAADLDKFWIQSTFEMPMGKGKMKFVAYTTFNPSDKKWYRYSVDNMGGAGWVTSAGAKDGKIVWEGESMSLMGKSKSRHTDDISDPKNTKVKGEFSIDGKTWLTGYEGTCKK